MSKKFSALVIFFVFSFASNLAAQKEAEYVPETDALVLKKLEQWQDLKFGLLMHWGPYSQVGIVESWSICSEDEPWCRRKIEDYEQYKKEYEGLKRTFYPVKFNPEEWARAAKNAGMRYVVFTTKHHDGFCMFDTKFTDYRITDPECPFSSSPRPNITKEIFNAFRKEGFWVGAYFSKPDWHSDYYWWPYFATPDRNVNYDIKRYPERWEKFIRFTHSQVDELMSDYGKIDILWFDGGWVRPLTKEEIIRAINRPDYKFTRIQSQDIRMDELVIKARQKQPGLIVVDRAVPGKNQNYLTPENVVPDEPLLCPWESCIISGGGWSWVPDAKYMSARKTIHLLVDIVAKGGNLLLNIAPGPDGTWDKGAYELLQEIGRWMKTNQEAIYNTRPVAPYKEGKVCLTRGQDKTIYAVYLADENETRMPSEISLGFFSPPEGAEITLLGAPEKLEWKPAGKGVLVKIPEKYQNNPPCSFAWTLKISL